MKPRPIAARFLCLGIAVPLFAVIASARAEQDRAQSSGAVREEVRVERVVVPGRVIDRFANPISGLSAGDFRVTVDGKEISIDAVDWISGEATPAAGLGGTKVGAEESRAIAENAGPPAGASGPRTLIMLFQWEIAGQKDTGFLRMMRQAERMIEATTPGDRTAVLGFGSSLRVLQDLTNDHAALKTAVRAIRSLNHAGVPAAGASLAGPVGKCGSKDSIQKAIVCISSALQTLPGPKTLLFFGWTIGRPSLYNRYVDYPLLVEAISKARTSVFVLDVSDGHHTLAPGLKQLAADTGGLYNGGCIYEMMYCADLATAKTQRAIDGGTYEIVFRDPTSGRGWHEIEVHLKRGNGIAIFARWYRS
jgi:VWFA-related protein